MPRWRVGVCQFPGGNSTHPAVSDWVTETVCKMRDDARIGPGNVKLWRVSDTPITMTRNRALLAMEHWGADYVLFIDSDMHPDYLLGSDKAAKPFWETAWEFSLAHAGPCVVAAPYSGPAPFENCYVFRWTCKESGHANPDFQIAAYPREEAARLSGVQRCAALPTGLMLMDMRGVKKLPHPRFDYEWKDDGPPCPHCRQALAGPRIDKASTEDVFFSRNLDYYGVPQYAAWDSWAGHYKLKLVGKPQEIPADCVPAWMRHRAVELEKLPTAPPGQQPAKPLPRVVVADPPRPAKPAAEARLPGPSANGHARKRVKLRG